MYHIMSQLVQGLRASDQTNTFNLQMRKLMQSSEVTCPGLEVSEKA